MRKSSSHAGSAQSAKVRTSKACDQCRKRKSKCGGEQPHCLVCETLKRHCTYNIGARKRGLQPGYVRSLEIVLGATFHHFPQADARIRNLLQSQSQSGKNELLDGDQAEIFAGRWRKSEVARGLGKISESSTQQGGEISDHDVAIQDVVLPSSEGTSYDAVNPSIIEDHTEPHHQYPMETVEALNHVLHVSEEATAVDGFLRTRLPQNATDLVDFYISNTHCWFPIIEHGELLKSIHVPLVNSSETFNHDMGMRLCLWAIIIFVLVQKSVNGTEIDVDKLQTQIRMAIVETGRNFEIGHIQALLILVLLETASSRFQAAWITSAQASRMVIDFASRHIENPTTYSRTIRGCELLDSLLSVLLCDTSCWSRKNLRLFENGLDDNSMDEWRTWDNASLQLHAGAVKQKQPLRSLSIFDFTSQLFRKLNISQCWFEGKQSMVEILQELGDWKHSLPKHCQLSRGGNNTQPLLCLHLSWHFVICSIGIEVLDQDSCFLATIESSAMSIMDLTNQYVDLSGLPGTCTLLSCYLTQASRCFEKLEQVGYTITEPRRKYECHQILCMLNDRAHNPGLSPGDIHDPQTVRREHMPTLDRQTTQAEDSSDPVHQQDSYIQTLSNPETAINTRETGNFARANEGPLGFNYGTQALEDTNSFDMQFLDMSLMLPTERPEQMTLLSRDLGFLDDNFGGDWLESMS